METSTLLLKTSCGQFFIHVDTIVRIEAISNYSRLHFADGSKLVVARLLKWFEEKLGAHAFARMNRGELINMHFLKPNQKVKAGFTLINGDFIKISRRKRKQVMDRLLAA